MVVVKEMEALKDMASNVRVMLDIAHRTTLRHENVVPFFGVYQSPSTPLRTYAVFELCGKGCLNKLLGCAGLHFSLQYSLAVDMARGLHYIHRSSLNTHGSFRYGIELVSPKTTRI